MKLPYWPRELRREELLSFIVGGFGGGFLIGLVLWIIFSYLKLKIDFASLETPFVGAVVSVVLIISSVMVYLAEASPRIFQKRGVAPFLYPLVLLLFAVFLSIAAFIIGTVSDRSINDFHLDWSDLVFYWSDLVFYWSASFLIIGAIFFFKELRTVVLEETFGATLYERTTYESREKKEPHPDEPSIIGKKVFNDKIQINKGDAILALCDSIEKGRRLAREIIRIGDYRYVIYITADRPWTIIKEMFKSYNKNLYCIDCFTNFYGLDEFKEAQKTGNFYPYTLRPVTIRKLHGELRDIRKRMVSKMVNTGKDWYQLGIWDREEKKKVIEELSSKEAEQEREENVLIIYDSVSALASIFDIEDLLKFLIHDTNVDKTIGRNTLLLVKKGVLEKSVIKKLESFCEVCLNPKVINGRMYIHINKIRDEESPEDFPIDC